MELENYVVDIEIDEEDILDHVSEGYDPEDVYTIEDLKKSILNECDIFDLFSKQEIIDAYNELKESE